MAKKAISPDNQKAFNKAVIEPLKASQIPVPDARRLMTVWTDMFAEMRFYELYAKELPEQKKLKNLHKDLERLSAKIKKLSLANDFEALELELEMSRYTIREMVRAKQKQKKTAATYPKALVMMTRALIEFWNTAVKSKKKITASNPGDTFQLREEMIKPSKNIKLKSIDHKHNPGGAFIQRVLATYFDRPLNNSQLQTLLDKAYKK
jgi:hypothetical protein